MKNRIEELVTEKRKSARVKKEKALKNAIEANPEEKEKLLKEFKQALDNRGKKIEQLKAQVDTAIKLGEVAEMVNLSYIAKTYFNKTRHWLYQKLNGNVVNGKKSAFTEEQIETLNFALKDISKKIGSLSING